MNKIYKLTRNKLNIGVMSFLKIYFSWWRSYARSIQLVPNISNSDPLVEVFQTKKINLLSLASVEFMS